VPLGRTTRGLARRVLIAVVISTPTASLARPRDPMAALRHEQSLWPFAAAPDRA